MIKKAVAIVYSASAFSAFCAAGELQNIESKIFSIDKLTTSRDLLVKLGLLDKWSKAEEEKILIDKSGGLGETTYTFKSIKLGKIEAISFSWLSELKTEDGYNDLVTRIEVVDISHYYVYRWRNGAYVQTETHEKISDDM